MGQIEVVNVQDAAYGALGDATQGDVSAHFIEAMTDARAAGLPLYIPPGKGTPPNDNLYLVEDLPLQDADHVIAAPGAIIKGRQGGTASQIFITQGPVDRAVISGGEYRNADAVVAHGSGTSNLAHCLFEDMIIRDVRAGFSLDATIKCTFRRLRFQFNPVEVCIEVTGKGAFNDNLVDDCRMFSPSVTDGIRILADAAASPCRNLTVRNTIFEVNAGRPFAIFGDVTGMTVDTCWFEGTALPTLVSPAVGRLVRALRFRDCWWNAGPSGGVPRELIQLEGDSGVGVRGGGVVHASEDGWVLVDVNGTGPADVLLEDVFVEDRSPVATPTYEEALFRIDPASPQRVTYMVHPGSVGVSGADLRNVHLEGWLQAGVGL